MSWTIGGQHVLDDRGTAGADCGQRDGKELARRVDIWSRRTGIDATGGISVSYHHRNGVRALLVIGTPDVDVPEQKSKLDALIEALPENSPFAPSPRAQELLLGYFGKSAAKPSHVMVVNLDYKNAVTTALLGPGQWRSCTHRRPSGMLSLEASR